MNVKIKTDKNVKVKSCDIADYGICKINCMESEKKADRNVQKPTNFIAIG